MIQLALYQPEIPQNVGSLLRLCACLGVPLHLIEPLGFVWTDRRFQRSSMDYRALCTYTRHPDWTHFIVGCSSRVILLTPQASQSLWEFSFLPDDRVVVGRESSGFPDIVLQTFPHRVMIPMKPLCRSLNMAMAASLVLGEALRQTSFKGS